MGSSRRDLERYGCFKVNVPLFKTSISVLAVILMTSGAIAEDEITAGTEAAVGGFHPLAAPNRRFVWICDWQNDKRLIGH